MRHHRPRYDERIAQTLAEHGVLGFQHIDDGIWNQSAARPSVAD